MSGAYALTISYLLAIAGLTSVLIWGLKKVSKVLDSKTDGVSVMREGIDEEPGSAAKTSQPGKGSISRISAGAIGAVAIAATFVGIGYWAIYARFFDPDDLAKFKDMGTYFLAGSAMFMPYAFNQLTEVFKAG